MSKKHVEEYYRKICDDYHEMIVALQDMEKEFNEGMVSPDAVDNMKKLIEPIKDNYMTISWIMYLLNQPEKSSKHYGYAQRQRKFTASLDPAKSTENIHSENKKIVTSMTRD